MNHTIAHANDDALEPATDAMLDATLDVALEWQMHLHSGKAVSSDRSAYAAWQLANPRHRAAAIQAESLWRDIGEVQVHAAPRRASSGKRWALAACLLMSVAAGGLGIAERDALLSDHHTGYGERQTLALSDGSTLQLDANTAVDVEISGTQRRVTVRHGQIHVQVARDPSRPFDVIANGGATRALGTGFNVRRGEHAVDVAVTEHSVRVSHENSALTAQVREGEHLRYSDRGNIGTPVSTDLHTVTAWQRGYLIFDNASLDDVISQMSQYRRGLVIVRDPALKQLRLTGVFRVDDTDALLAALPQSLPVRLRRLPGLVLIESNSAS